MFFLFQGSLAHCKHIISHVLCITETRDIVCSWLLGSMFVTTKFYKRNWFQDLYSGEKCKNTVWRMSINNSDCVICEIISDWHYTLRVSSWQLDKELFKEVSQLFAAFYIHRLNYSLPLRTSVGGYLNGLFKWTTLKWTTCTPKNDNPNEYYLKL